MDVLVAGETLIDTLIDLDDNRAEWRAERPAGIPSAFLFDNWQGRLPDFSGTKPGEEKALAAPGDQGVTGSDRDRAG